VRGLNYATNAANSAESIISALFGKKRNQLVAVWVTSDGTTSTFQTINNSVRKYDSLRGKYIAAYVDCLRLCRQRKELDTFLRWAMSCKRDLPLFFSATADSQSGKPDHSHSTDTLVVKARYLNSFYFLTSVKRITNCGLAYVILHDMNDREEKKTDARYYETQLKISYACFLRLKSDLKVLTKSRVWKFHRENGVKDVVEALTTAYLKVSKDQPLSSPRADWSGESQLTSLLESALTKCKELFPSLTASFYFSRPNVAGKGKDAEGTKRKGGTVKKSFEVAVPEGLSEGDSFLATIQVGDSTKKVRLTVPSGSAASSLRFNLDVPAAHVGSDSEHETKKKRR
jgi:hypothetical protein